MVDPSALGGYINISFLFLVICIAMGACLRACIFMDWFL